MLLKTFGSGSSGNAYALISDKGTLLIECGLPFMEVARGLDYDISKVCGAIVSHEHG